MATPSPLRRPDVDRLFDAILTLTDREQCYRFFEDLCTIREIHAMAARFEVARRLYRGETYEKISAETGMSSATISRIKRFLDYGAGGYREVLALLEEPEHPRT